MTSSNIQDYIFDNKEKIPDGIYKGIQDLLKKQYEDEKYNGLFEVKYIEMTIVSKLNHINYGSIGSLHTSSYYNWVDEEFLDIDSDSDCDHDEWNEKVDEYEKQKKKTKVFAIDLDTHDINYCSKICKLCDNDPCNQYINWIKHNKIDKRIYKYIQEGSSYNMNLEGKYNYSYISHNIDKTIMSKKTKIIITDIKPYKS